MQTFLSRVATEVIKNNSDSLGDTTIILPSRRAIVFLREEFKKQLTTTTWLPQFYSLEDFVVSLGKFQQLDRIDLIFELYAVHQQIEGKNAEAFHEFLNWANLLLQDFNEIDRYMIDGAELFSFLTEAKAIEAWNLTGDPLTEFQLKYLKFWRKLSHYYEQFKARLIEKNQFYQGLGFRQVAEKLEEGKINTEHISTIYFTGFNALTTAEEKIINHFTDAKSGYLLWDADEYYLNDNSQEAGKFLREHKKRDKTDFNWITNSLLTEEKQLDIYGISGNIGQAKLIGNLLSTSASQNSNSSTAVVLSDEELLLPVLEAIPSSIDRINVTMGYPVKSSPFYFWIESFFKIFKTDTRNSARKGLYFQDIKYFLSHSAFSYLSRPKTDAIRLYLQELNTSKAIFIASESFEPLHDSIQIPLFKDYSSNVSALVNTVHELIKLVRIEGKGSLSSLDQEVLYFLSASFKRLEELVSTPSIDFSIDSLLNLFKNIVGAESVSFVGEPLGGLQIMGVLESRTLGFEHVIISSVNEGVLPSGKTQNSFIPFDIKVKFGLPSYKEKDAIFGYHFYRLLQGANKISIIYNTKVDQLQGGERSRFIEQLLYEVPQKNSKIKINQHTIAPKLPREPEHNVQIEKNQQILAKIEQHFKEGISASALNTYLSCPLDYYYKYILGLKEKKNLEEKVESRTLGTIVHNVLEQIYQPMLNQLIDKKGLQSAKASIESQLKMEFFEQLKVEPTQGNHKINFEVAKHYIINLIEYDLSQLKDGKEIQLLSLEESFEQSIEIQLTDKTSKKISLKGKIDRIDRYNGLTRIIDYKTGATKAVDLTYKNPEDTLKGKKSKAIQMLLYNAAYDLKQPNSRARAGIISLKNLSSGFMALNEKIDSTEDLSSILRETVLELTNKDIPFEHNKDAEYCTFCSNKKEVFN
ncbi:MAG: PD-(D/E)XK nuclease family protein [Vicingaceae bacterium]